MAGYGAKQDFSVNVPRDNAIMAAMLGTPATFPTVVGLTPAPAAPPASAADLIAKVDKTLAATPIDAPGTPAPVNYDNVVAEAMAKTRGNITDLNTPGAFRGGVTAATVAAPVAAPAAAKPAINSTFLTQQQDLMAQIAAAQQVVQAGSNRDGYKMGDVTKALATMNMLSPLVASTNNLMANAYGTDAGMLNHSVDSATRMSIANAGNQTEIDKTNLAGEFGIQREQMSNDAAAALADTRAKAEAATPQGMKAALEAERLDLENKAIKTGGFGAIRTPQYHYSTDPISGKVTEVWENGAPGVVDPRAATIAAQQLSKNKGK